MVTSAANGAIEAIVEGGNGLVVRDPLDRTEVAEAVERALALEAPSVFKVSDRTLGPYDWEQHRRAMLVCYEEVIARRDGRRVAA